MLLFFVTDWVKISCSTCLNCHWWVSVESEHGCPLSLQQSSHLLCSPCSMTRQVSFACPALPLQSLCVIGSVKQQWLFEEAKRARTGQGRYTDKDGWMYWMGDIWRGYSVGSVLRQRELWCDKPTEDKVPFGGRPAVASAWPLTGTLSPQGDQASHCEESERKMNTNKLNDVQSSVWIHSEVSSASKNTVKTVILWNIITI